MWYSEVPNFIYIAVHINVMNVLNIYMNILHITIYVEHYVSPDNRFQET